MASKLPAVKNSAFTFRCVLFAQSDNQIKANPTIAAGDWKVSTDGAAFANLATLPDVDPDTTAQVLVSLSAGEMNGDEIMVTAIDASGAEWHSAAWVIHTAAQTFDTMDTNIDSILADTGTDGVVLANDAITAGKFDESTAFPLKSADTGATQVARVGADGDTLETLSDQIDATATAAALATVDGIVDDILLDTAEIGAAGAGLTALATQASVNDLPTNSELTTALAAADDAVLAAIAALNDLSSAGAQAAAAAALAAYDAATGTDVTNATSPLATAAALATVDGIVDDILVDTSTTLPAAIAGVSAPTAAAVADAVWDEALAGHLAAGSTGEALSDAGGASASPADIADAVWDEAIAGHLGAGSTGAALNTSTGTGLVGGIQVVTTLYALRGDSMTLNFAGLGNITGRDSLWFTVKQRRSHADADSMIQIEETAGLMYIAGGVADTPLNGAIVVTDAGDGDLTVTLAPVEVAKMPVDRTLYYDVQVLESGAVSTPATGTIVFTADVTRATS